MCDKDAIFLFPSLVQLSVCSHPHPTPVSFSLFTLLLLHFHRQTSPACFYLEKRRISIKRPMQEEQKRKTKTFTFESKTRMEESGRAVQGEMTISFGAYEETVIVALHQTLLSFECEIRQLIIIRAEANIILNLRAISSCSDMFAFCRNSHVALIASLCFLLFRFFPPLAFYSLQSKHMKRFHRI
jgi:hypothetical protein